MSWLSPGYQGQDVPRANARVHAQVQTPSAWANSPLLSPAHVEEERSYNPINWQIFQARLSLSTLQKPWGTSKLLASSVCKEHTVPAISMNKHDEFLALQFSQGQNWSELVLSGHFLFGVWTPGLGVFRGNWGIQWFTVTGRNKNDISGTLCSFSISCPFKIKGIRKSDPHVYTMQKSGFVNRGQVKQAKMPGKYNLSHRFAVFHINFSTAVMTGRSG